MIDSGDDLSKYTFSFVLGELALLGYARVQFAARRILGHDVNLIRCFDDFVQTDDVWMMQTFHGGYFT